MTDDWTDEGIAELEYDDIDLMVDTDPLELRDLAWALLKKLRANPRNLPEKLTRPSRCPTCDSPLHRLHLGKCFLLNPEDPRVDAVAEAIMNLWYGPDRRRVSPTEAPIVRAREIAVVALAEADRCGPVVARETR